MSVVSKLSRLMNISRQIEMLTNPYFLALTEGTYDSVVTFNTIYGADTNGIGATQELLSDGTQTITFPPHGSNATVVKISSSNANDTVLGTGARTVYVEGLDQDYKKVNETVNTNGQTEVLTLKRYSRINRLVASSQGINTSLTIGKMANQPTSNIGTIYCGTGTVTAGVPATIYSTIQPSVGYSRQALCSFPTGYFPIMKSPSSISGSGKLVEYKIWYRFGFDNGFIETFTWDNFQQMGSLNFSIGGIYYTAGDIIVTASGSTSPEGIVLVEFVMVRNDLLAELQAELVAI